MAILDDLSDRPDRGRDPAAAEPASRVSGRALRWLAACLEAERDRWALWLPVFFGAGIGLYFALPAEPPTWLGGAGLIAAVGGAVLLHRSAAPFVAALALIAGTGGFLAAQARVALVDAPVLAKRLGPVWVSGEIVALEPRPKGVRLTLAALRIARLDPAETPARVRIGAFSADPDLRPGDHVRMRAVLRSPPAPAAPGAFDFARRAYFERLGAVGFAFGAVQRAEPAPGEGMAAVGGAPGLDDWRTWWAGLRGDVARRILAALPGQAGAVAAALMTGERGTISEQVMADMRDSGLAHLLAISGLHVGLIAGLILLGLRAGLALFPRLALDFPIKKWAAVGALAGAFAYLMLTGATIPTQRAFLMLSLVLGAVLLDRSALSMRLVAWAAFAVLAIAPESLLSASFQLSFAAVAALIAGYEVVRERRRGLFAERGAAGRIGLYLAGVALTSVVAGLATAPFALYHFNRIAWYGLAANLLAVPLTGLWIMPWALAAFCLMPFGLEELALVPMGRGVDAMLGVAAWVAGWPGAVSVVPAMPSAGLVLCAFGGVWLCLWRRPWRLAGLGVVLAGLATVPLTVSPDLLVSGDGRLFGVRAPDGTLHLSSEAVRRFDAEIWRRRVGEEQAEAWPRLGESLDGHLRCDPLGCIYRGGGQVVALVVDGRALDDDCRMATVVISREPARRGVCRGAALVIDRFDLWRDGAHALWLGADGVAVETVAGQRGARPWAARRGAASR